jgi:predicted nucleic acid-binding protein
MKRVDIVNIKRYVPDANVILEYVFGRRYSESAKMLFEDAIRKKIQLLTPSIMLDEITEVLCGNLDDTVVIQRHLNYLERLSLHGVLHIVVPNTETRMKAIEIARTGHEKSGYPELADGLYHAVAILNGGIFLTNDGRHYSKVKNIGHIERLSEYQRT